MAEIRSSIYSLINSCLFEGGGELPAANDPAWSAILDELISHNIYALAANYLEQHQIDDKELLTKWKKLNINVQLNSLKIMAVQQSLVKLFSDAGIPFVVIKGSAAAMAYPMPFYRSMGDIDLLVKRRDFEKTCKLLRKAGYIESGNDPEGHHHAGFTKNGVEVELHRRLGSVPESNESLLALFEAGIDKREDQKMGSFTFPVLPKYLNGIVLLLHINQHLRVGIGLRQIIDWMLFVDKKLDDDAYNDDFKPLISRLGLEKFCVCVTALCQRYLGLRKDIVWCSGADDTVVEELMDYIMNKGNFGRKTGDEGHISSVYLRAKNPFKLLSMLQKGGLRRWEAAKKLPVLRPFAWAYQIKFGLKEMKEQNLTAKDMAKLRDEGLRQRELIESLGLDADRNLYAELE